MSETPVGLLNGERYGNWVRLRTLILLRWVAVFGQLAAILIASRQYELQLELGFCFATIGASAVANLIAMFVFPENKRLSEFENFLMVLFDLIQLSLLLYLTGGLNNPFALLILAPVTVSANVLGTRSFLIIGATAIFSVSTLTIIHFPLRTEFGFILQMPDLYKFGHWVAMVIAIGFIGIYSRRVSSEIRSMSDALTATNLALSREQKLTDLGGVVAAAAHELGTPLATIKLTSAELIEELEDQPELREDAALIREQADRCRDILRDMGRAGKDDLHLRKAPLSTVINEAAEPHMQRGKEIFFEEQLGQGGNFEQPTILRKPEIIHGLRNLVQNAVDFAATSVWIETSWTDSQIVVRIVDDGRGYPTHILGRIGDPFVRKRRTETDRKPRPGYEGMGLGLFIAKTLLERTGAVLTFSNGNDIAALSGRQIKTKTGAIVVVRWPRQKVDALTGDTPAPTGLNTRFEV